MKKILLGLIVIIILFVAVWEMFYSSKLVIEDWEITVRENYVDGYKTCYIKSNPTYGIDGFNNTNKDVNQIMDLRVYSKGRADSFKKMKEGGVPDEEISHSFGFDYVKIKSDGYTDEEIFTRLKEISNNGQARLILSDYKFINDPLININKIKAKFDDTVLVFETTPYNSVDGLRIIESDKFITNLLSSKTFIISYILKTGDKVYFRHNINGLIEKYNEARIKCGLNLIVKED